MIDFELLELHVMAKHYGEEIKTKAEAMAILKEHDAKHLVKGFTWNRDEKVFIGDGMRGYVSELIFIEPNRYSTCLLMNGIVTDREYTTWKAFKKKKEKL